MKNIFVYLFTSIPILVPVLLFSQKPACSIRGIVLLADGESTQGITVFLQKADRMATTNNKGIFIIDKLPATTDSLMISSVGTHTFSREVVFVSGHSLDIGTIYLTKNVKILQTVEINGRAAHSYKSDYSFFGAKTETPAKDIPQSISAITKELIHDKMEFTLKEAVGDVAGVNQYSGYDEYTIRGFRSENARDINGLRGYNTTYTSSMLVNIERVEVIKGPTATLYGNGDAGGTINLVTKKPLDHTEGELNIFGGSWDHFRAEGDVTGAINKNKTLLYRLNAGYDQKNSFRDQIHGKSYQVAPSFTLIPNNKIKINFDFSVSHITTVLDQGQPGFDNSEDLKATPIKLSLSQPGNYLTETDVAAILSFSYKFSKRLSYNMGYLNYNTSQNVASHGFNDYITPDSVSLFYTTYKYQTVTHTLTNYFTYLANTGIVNHKILLGYDYIQSKVNLTQQYFENPDEFGVGRDIVSTFSLLTPQYNQLPPETYQPSDFNNDASNVGPTVYHTQGVYVQDELSLSRWTILVSLREEFYKGDNTDSAGRLRENVFLPRLGIVYALKPNLNVYATYNKGFEPFETSRQAQVFTQPFKPIISKLYEVGLKGNCFQNNLAASLTFYQLTVENVAINAGDPSNPNLFVQQGQNRSRGIEAEAAGNILPNLNVLLSYAYDVATVTQDKDPAVVGTIVANAPRNSSTSWIKYSFNKNNTNGFGISIGHSFVGQRTTLDSNTNLPSYFLLNGGIHYGFKKMSLTLILNNILNETFWAGAYNNVYKWPGAPRNLMVNLGFKF